MTIFGIASTVLAILLLGAFVLFGAGIDGRRQKLLEAGKQPVTTPSGTVEAQGKVDTSDRGTSAAEQ